MNKSMLTAAAVFLISAAPMAIAAGDYNDVPSSDPQYKSCISYANKNYEGGNAASPIPGQTKVAAYCECMWNETDEDFKGNLVKFAESPQGKRINKICEKYSNWSE